MGKLCFKNYDFEQMALVEFSWPPRQPSQTARTAVGGVLRPEAGTWVPGAGKCLPLERQGDSPPWGGNGGGTYIT